MAEHTERSNIDTVCLAIAGNSVGAYMVATASLTAKKRNGPATRFDVLFRAQIYGVSQQALAASSQPARSGPSRLRFNSAEIEL